MYSPLNCFTTGALFSLSPPLCKNNNNTLILLNSEQLFAEGNDIFSSIYIVDIQWAYNEQLFCNSLNVYRTEMGEKSLFSFQKIPLIQIDCKTIRIFSSTREPSNKTLGGGWKRRARLGRDARPMGVWSSRASARETLKVDFTTRYDIRLRLSCATSIFHDFATDSVV